MPPRSRRTLLTLLGTATATVVAGCETTSEADTGTASPTRSPTASPSPTATESPTDGESPTETADGLRCEPAPRPDAAWPVARRSPAGDGYVVAPNDIAARPAVVWTAEPTAPPDSTATPRYGQPVVGHGTVYLVNRLDRGPQRPEYGHVHALDPATGERRWHSDRLRAPATPIVWGDLVVVAAETEELETRVLAVDRTDGTRRWTREIAARTRGLVAAGDHLYLALAAATEGGSVYALAKDGRTVWHRSGAFADHVSRGPIAGLDRVYAATNDGRLHAFDRADGTTAWTHTFTAAADDQPYVSDLVATDCGVFAVVEGAVHALATDGATGWTVAGDHGPLATDGHTVYTGVTIEGTQRELRALTAATGDRRWAARGDIEAFRPPVVAGDTILASFETAVVALDRADGEERWRTARPLGDLALADGTLYGIDGGTLVALR